MTPSIVTFSPTTISLNNPTASSETTSPVTISFSVSIADSEGQSVLPSPDRPLTITVHGAPDGVISPASASITSGSTVTFTYNGGYFQNSILITASIPNGAGGSSIGTARLLQSNPVCDYTQPGLQTFTLDLLSPQTYLSDGLFVNAAVGYAEPTKAVMQPFQIDTGSLGVVLPASELGSTKIGPGAPSEKYYDSSGNIYSGNLYLAPVSFQTSDGGFISTISMPVLAVTSTSCAPNARQCDPAHPPANDLHYLGVGFDRNSTTANDLAIGPSFNPFLNLTDDAHGSDIAPGYMLAGSSGQVQLGITASVVSGFDLAALTANQNVPGDWDTSPGCFGFPDLSAQFCGTLLMDVGITEMFLQLPEDQRPAAVVESSGDSLIVPLGARMSILAGSSSDPIMSYTFTNGSAEDALAPVGKNVPNVSWAGTQSAFVNTGRHVLAGFNYLFDAQCGQVGYQALH